MKGITQVAEELHYTILIRETQSNTLTADEYSEMIFSKQADGIVLLASVCPFTSPLERPGRNSQQPIIICCESVTPELSQFPSVRIDNINAAKEATEYLINLGHSRIGFIQGSHTSTLTQDRERGFRKAMKTHGFAIEDGWVVEGSLTIEGARKATRKLINHPQRPTAIFCANDEMAMGALHEVKAANLQVPKDISIVGFDDIRYAEILDPPLTTIAQPAEEIGERTMLRLSRAIEGRDIGTKAEIAPHKLIVRRSTAAPPQKLV